MILVGASYVSISKSTCNRNTQNLKRCGQNNFATSRKAKQSLFVHCLSLQGVKLFARKFFGMFNTTDAYGHETHAQVVGAVLGVQDGRRVDMLTAFELVLQVALRFK